MVALMPLLPLPTLRLAGSSHTPKLKVRLCTTLRLVTKCWPHVPFGLPVLSANARAVFACVTVETLRNGLGSITPTSALEPTHEVLYRVICDYEALEEGDLEVSEGEIISVLEKSDDEFWRCSRRDGSQEGLVPATYLETV